ncbi:hypothetical protein F5Y04DRAFT_255107 [Hypomontagnella monticulosa]|nr:hypothetical protein F5Y04DRAFT_255107 [Hypomontagnella monticulosa]
MDVSLSHMSSGSSDLSEDYSLHESIPHSTVASTAMPPPEAQGQEMDKYSDEQIRILYEIVLRAEELLSELTPSSRLPTHALYNAYDQILDKHDINPDDDQLISELVFKVGGIKDTNSLRKKFKTAMARLGITVEHDDTSALTSDGDDASTHPSTPDDLSIADSVDRYLAINRNAYNANYEHAILRNQDERRPGNAEGNLSSGNDPADLSKIEQQLENSAIAFREKHLSKFSTVTAFRQWQKKSNFIAHMCEQFDAARLADLEEDVEAKFETWRTMAREVENMPPQMLPPGVYSKRIEGLAVRAHEIHATELVLRRWRQAAREQSRETQKAEKPPDPLERVLTRAHNNLMLSRAFTDWSNRWEEESAKAQMAAKIYEMSLKSKAFAIRKHPGDSANLVASPNPIISDSIPRPLASNDIVSDALPDDAGPSSVVVDVRDKTSPDAPREHLAPNDTPEDPNDGIDETTLLARRHILRMRYYDAWEKYTADNLNKVRDFCAEQESERIARTIPIWQSQAEEASQKQETLHYNAERASYYNKAIKAIDGWRQESQAKVQGQHHVLKDYATRANFYYKTTKSLPVWRNKAEHATQQREVFELYAGRAEYYYMTTKSLPHWRRQAQEAAEHEEQTLARYAERADYYYRTQGTLLAWHDLAKQKRKQRLKEAHLETRRLVKKGMGERCIAKWRESLQPSIERSEALNATLEDIVAEREWKQTVEALDLWRDRAQERSEMGAISDATVKGRILEQWRDKSTLDHELYLEAEEHWKEKALSQVLKTWNLSSLQLPNRPLIVENTLEKKDRKLLRTGFETWYERTADKLVPVELPDGSLKSVEQVVEDARYQASLNQARGLFDTWKAASKNKGKSVQRVPQDVYTPTPGRPRIFLGGLGRSETTTPLAPVPSLTNWRASETAIRNSAIRGKASRSGRPERNLRVSWAQ